MMIRSTLRWLTVGSLVTCWPLPGRAQPVAPARPPATLQPPSEAELESREAEAKRACDAGQVEEGARVLRELFRLTDDGTYIFNLGRCYQQNGQAQLAVPQFRAYLARPDVDPAAAARAREHIATLDRPTPAAVVPAPTPPAPPAAAVPAVVSSSPPSAWPAASELVATSPSPPAPSPARAFRVGGLVTGGVGLAGLATGAVYALRTRSLEQEKSEALEQGNKPVEWFAAHDEEGERAERRQWMFLGVGGAALLAGGALYYLGTRSEAAGAAGTPAAAQAVPLVTPGILGAALLGRF